MKALLKTENLWDIRTRAIDEEHKFINDTHRQTAFYAGIVTTILGASVGGALKAEYWFQFILLLCGPVAAVSVSRLGIRSAFRYYSRFLEALSVRLKVEHDLGFDEPRNATSQNMNGLWPAEPYWPPRCQALMKAAPPKTSKAAKRARKCSRAWMKYHQGRSELSHIRRLFQTLIVLSVLVAIVLVSVTLWLMVEPSALGKH